MGDESSGRSQQFLKGKRVLYREEPATLFFKVKQQADFQFSTGEQIVVIRSAGHFLHAPTGESSVFDFLELHPCSAGFRFQYIEPGGESGGKTTENSDKRGNRDSAKAEADTFKNSEQLRLPKRLVTAFVVQINYWVYWNPLLSEDTEFNWISEQKQALCGLLGKTVGSRPTGLQMSNSILTQRSVSVHGKG